MSAPEPIPTLASLRQRLPLPPAAGRRPPPSAGANNCIALFTAGIGHRPVAPGLLPQLAGLAQLAGPQCGLDVPAGGLPPSAGKTRNARKLVSISDHCSLLCDADSVARRIEHVIAQGTAENAV